MVCMNSAEGFALQCFHSILHGVCTVGLSLHHTTEGVILLPPPFTAEVLHCIESVSEWLLQLPFAVATM